MNNGCRAGCILVYIKYIESLVNYGYPNLKKLVFWRFQKLIRFKDGYQISKS